MTKKLGVIILSLCFLSLGGKSFALNNTCFPTDNRICGVSDDLMKEMIKQTVYTVGTHMLNKLAPAGVIYPTTVPVAVPAPVTTPVPVTTPIPVTTPAPVVTTIPVTTPEPVTTTEQPAEQMIIVK